MKFQHFRGKFRRQTHVNYFVLDLTNHFYAIHLNILIIFERFKQISIKYIYVFIKNRCLIPKNKIIKITFL